MKTTFIYTLSDPITKEVRYIGKANNIYSRFRSHLNEKRDIHTHKQRWIKLLRDKGLKPIIEVIDEVPIEEWQFWEHWWYLIFKSWGFSLVNCTACGDGLSFGNSTSFYKDRGAKKISAFDNKGNLIKEFDSEISACKYFNINAGHLNKVLKGIQKTAKNMAWFYSDNIPNTESIVNKFKKVKAKNNGFEKGHVPWNKDINYTRKGKSVEQYSLDGILLNTFSSCAEAARYVNGNQDSISACCRGINKTSKNYIWKYVNRNER